MRFVNFLFFFLIVLCHCAKEETSPIILTEADFYQIPALTKQQSENLGKLMVALNANRNQQRVVLDRIRKYGLKALPALLTGLEQGTANTQQGCLEALRSLEQGRSVVHQKSIDNVSVLRAWYLAELERGYHNLATPVEIRGKKRSAKKVREVYRQHVCTLLEGMMTPQVTSRLLSAIKKEDTEIVRAAIYRAVGSLQAGLSHLPKLIEIYATEQDIARDYLWQTLKRLTGKNYPNDPRVWTLWLEKESLK